MYKLIKQTTQPDITRVDCFKSCSPQLQADFTFWVPTAALDEHGWVPGDVIRARIKHHVGHNQGLFTFQPG